jgi:hypothetical protein
VWGLSILMQEHDVFRCHGTLVCNMLHSELCGAQAGLSILRQEPDVFKCHGSLMDTIWHSELGASEAILRAGHNLDCLLMKYQGIDWRDSNFWNCNGKWVTASGTAMESGSFWNCKWVTASGIAMESGCQVVATSPGKDQRVPASNHRGQNCINQKMI